MTRFIHDKFAKDYLEELLKPYGKVEAQKPVSGEVRYIDVFFSPFIAEIPHLEILGLLGQFATIPAIFEPFRKEHPYRRVTLELLYNLQQNLKINQAIESDDRELIMRLAPLYQEEKERIKQEGRQEGEQRLILLWLTRKFGELDSLFIEQIQALSVEQLDLLGEAVIDFSEITQLENWLRNIEVLLPLSDRETPTP